MSMFLFLVQVGFFRNAKKLIKHFQVTRLLRSAWSSLGTMINISTSLDFVPLNIYYSLNASTVKNVKNINILDENKDGIQNYWLHLLQWNIYLERLSYWWYQSLNFVEAIIPNYLKVLTISSETKSPIIVHVIKIKTLFFIIFRLD